ncbi:MAG TPA: LPS export ABC transporter periplasmic protein LptC [Draconibacterium sp.]|nr:LPS export ABC transporter periplasmic protein LptC [Draconibacterium sp.]
MKTPKFVFNTLQLIKTLRIAVPVLGTAILFFACKQNDIEKIKAFSSPQELPVLEATNFQTLSTDSGTVRFLLKAKKLLQFENDGKNYHEFPEGLLLVEYDENSSVVSSIKADYAIEYIKEEKWEAKNNVIVTNEKGDTLKTEHLILDENKGKIYTEEFVTIVSNDKIITGTGLTSDQDMLNWEIKSPKGIIEVTVDNNQKEKKNTNIEEAMDNSKSPVGLDIRQEESIKFR